MKQILELGPVVVFALAYALTKKTGVTVAGTHYDGFVFATLLFVPAMVVSMALLWRQTGRLSVMQGLTLVLVVVFGGLTVWMNDPHFFKMKPTFIYLIFAALLAFGQMTGRNWLGMVFDGALRMSPAGWRVLTWRLVGFFIALAIANEVIWRNLSETTWVWFKFLGLPVLMVVFMLLNAGLFQATDKD